METDCSGLFYPHSAEGADKGDWASLTALQLPFLLEPYRNNGSYDINHPQVAGNAAKLFGTGRTKGRKRNAERKKEMRDELHKD